MVLRLRLNLVRLRFLIVSSKDFGSAPNGALTKFAGEGTLFTVTYNVTGNVIGTSVATDISVINSVSSDLNIASKPVTVENGSYTFVDETSFRIYNRGNKDNWQQRQITIMAATKQLLTR